MAERVRVREISNEEGNRLLRIVRRSSGSVVTWRRAQMVLAVGPGDGRGPDRQGGVHLRGPGPGGHPQLQRRRVRLALPHATPAAGRRRSRCRSGRRSRRSRSAGRSITACRSRPGVWPSWPTSWSLRGWSTTSATRACGCSSARRASRFQAHEDLEDLATTPTSRPRRTGCSSSTPSPTARPKPKPGRPDRGDLRRRVRAAEPPAPPRQAVGAGRAASRRPRPAAPAAAPGHLQAARTASATCWPPTTCRPTGSTGTSRPRRAAPSSWPSAATSGRCTRPRCGSPSCSTTSAPT